MFVKGLEKEAETDKSDWDRVKALDIDEEAPRKTLGASVILFKFLDSECVFWIGSLFNTWGHEDDNLPRAFVPVLLLPKPSQRFSSSKLTWDQNLPLSG